MNISLEDDMPVRYAKRYRHIETKPLALPNLYEEERTLDNHQLEKY